MIIIKTSLQVSQIRENGLILREAVNEAALLARPGMSTLDLDKLIEEKILASGSTPTFKGYRGFPAAACISVNDVYVHGIPSKKVILKEGDIISIDIGVTKNGCIADSCYTFALGKASEEHKQLMKVAHDATMLGVEMAKPGVRVNDIAKGVFEYVTSFKDFTVAEGLYGHGTGTILHEPPTMVFTYPVPKNIPNVKLVEGMVITIEPVIGFKSSKGQYTEDPDKWTLRSLDGTYGAQFEHTIHITNSGNEILTGVFKPLDL